MERLRTITIDRYDGIMSADIALNQAVAQKFMQAADMRRDVHIGKKNDQEQTSVDNLGETLAFKRLVVSHLELHQRPAYKVIKNTDSFEIDVDDQKIHQQADRQMSRRYKRLPGVTGHQSYRQEFLARLNMQVASGLKDVLKSEKLGIQDQLQNYYAYFLFNGVLIPTSTAMGQSFSPRDIIGFVIGNLVINALYNFSRSGYQFDLPAYRKNENKLLPLVPVDRYVRGYWQILQNGSKLIVEKDSKER